MVYGEPQNRYNRRIIMIELYLVDTNRGQLPANLEEAYIIADKAGYTKDDIAQYFETNNELTINWKGWHFKFAV